MDVFAHGSISLCLELLQTHLKPSGVAPDGTERLF